MTPINSPTDLASALLGNARSLGLVSQTGATLKTFSQQVLACIRSMDGAVLIDEYSGTEFLNLISKLNQAVAPYLQQQAQPTNKQGPSHVWVIDQADRLSSEQQSIIFRLIELFPALPFRVIWLSRQPLQAWQDHAHMASIFLDLDADDMSVMTRDPLDNALTENRDVPETAWSATALYWPALGVGKNLKIAATLAGAAVLGTLAWTKVSAPSPSEAESNASAVAATMAASSAAAVADPVAVPASAPAIPAESPPTVSETPKPAPPFPAAHKALPNIARTGVQWLKALPADTLVVEHGTFSSADQAQKLQAKHKELSLARIIAVRKTPNADEWQYSVVTGPFRSEDRAKSYVSRLEWRANTRIRGTDKLKPLLASAP